MSVLSLSCARSTDRNMVTTPFRRLTGTILPLKQTGSSPLLGLWLGDLSHRTLYRDLVSCSRTPRTSGTQGTGRSRRRRECEVFRLKLLLPVTNLYEGSLRHGSGDGASQTVADTTSLTSPLSTYTESFVYLSQLWELSLVVSSRLGTPVDRDPGRVPRPSSLGG